MTTPYEITFAATDSAHVRVAIVDRVGQVDGLAAFLPRRWTTQHYDSVYGVPACDLLVLGGADAELVTAARLGQCGSWNGYPRMAGIRSTIQTAPGGWVRGRDGALMGGMANPAIVTVDDDPAVSRAVARDVRRRYGDRYRVVRADSGEAALEALREIKLR